MANAFPSMLHLFFFVFFMLLLVRWSHQLQYSQSEALLNLQQQLNYPSVLSSWSAATDFCNTEPTPSLTLLCYEDNVTQLHINGNNGLSPPPPLPESFSAYSFFSNLANLPSLKVLSLVSVGLRGPIPSTIGSISSLEILNISSNYLEGTIPQVISGLTSIQTMVMDHNKLTGAVPDGLSSLPSLAVLSLKNNSLSGELPSSFSSLESLRVLSLSANHLSGKLPQLTGLTNLQILDLEGNSFGPHFPNLPNKLVSLVLRKNRFRFGLSSSNLNSLYHLEKLDVSLNHFVGPFLPSLLSLPSLIYLDISGNKFTARLFKNLSCSSDLDFVNLSSNRLTGDLPACLEVDSESRVVMYAENCLSSREKNQQHPYSFCLNEALAVRIRPHTHGEKRPSERAVVASSMMGGVGGVALLGLAFLVIRRQYAKKMDKSPNTRVLVDHVSPAYTNTVKLLTDARYISETMKLGSLGIPSYRTYSLDELKEATNRFDSSNIIGQGSLGQVYKGWLIDGTVVAIRILKMRKRQALQTCRHQIELISKLRHCHLVSVLGHCFECLGDDSNVSRIFLVLEFVPNGTLRSFLSEGKKFTWTQRIAAAIGVVRGIQFLHRRIVPGVFSNRLTITDVLLDHDLHVKISRYNLSLLVENGRQVRMNEGFFSAGVKENIESRLNYEDNDDIYDFGVILLEIIVGRAILCANDIKVSRDILQVSLTADDIARRNIVDPAVHKECCDESLKILVELCVRCLCSDATSRPSVDDVLWNLQFAAQIQERWNGEAKDAPGSPVMHNERE